MTSWCSTSLAFWRFVHCWTSCFWCTTYLNVLWNPFYLQKKILQKRIQNYAPNLSFLFTSTWTSSTIGTFTQTPWSKLPSRAVWYDRTALNFRVSFAQKWKQENGLIKVLRKFIKKTFLRVNRWFILTSVSIGFSAVCSHSSSHTFPFSSSIHLTRLTRNRINGDDW